MPLTSYVIAHKPTSPLQQQWPPEEMDHYLFLTPEGRTVWTADPDAATAFETMREATRVALRLPGAFRTYALPLRVDPKTTGQLH